MAEVFFIMMVPITAILTTGAVLILRPITSRMGNLLEVMTQERRERANHPDVAQLRDLLASVEGRISLLEERQDFAEALLDSGQRRPRRTLPEVVEAGRH